MDTRKNIIFRKSKQFPPFDGLKTFFIVRADLHKMFDKHYFTLLPEPLYVEGIYKMAMASKAKPHEILPPIEQVWS